MTEEVRSSIHLQTSMSVYNLCNINYNRYYLETRVKFFLKNVNNDSCFGCALDQPTQL